MIMDHRTLREKLLAMAAGGTPPEQVVAKAKLALMDARNPPRRPPTYAGPAAPIPEQQQWGWTHSASSSNRVVWVDLAWDE